MSETTVQAGDPTAAQSFFERPDVHLETIEVGPGVPLGIEQAANPGIGIGGAYGTWGVCCPNEDLAETVEHIWATQSATTGR